jgi:hypothetical protein
MSARLGYIFWGLIFVVVHIKINGFDLLPDIIGYALIAFGATGLVSLSPQFGLAGSLSVMLAVGWMIGLAVSGGAAVAFGLLMTAVNCGMVWSLLGGIIDFTRSKERHDLAEKAQNRRVAYVVSMGVIWLLLLVARESRSLAALAAVTALIAMLVILVLILHLVHRVRFEVAE